MWLTVFGISWLTYEHFLVFGSNMDIRAGRSQELNGYISSSIPGFASKESELKISKFIRWSIVMCKYYIY